MKDSLLIFILALPACVAMPSNGLQTKEIKTTMRVEQIHWYTCKDLCGKKDEVLAITQSHCLCANGRSFLHGYELLERKYVEPELREFQREDRKPTNIMDAIGIPSGGH